MRGSGGIAQGAAATDKEADGDAGGFAFLTALGEPVLHGPGVADLLAGNAGDHHDLSVLQETAVVSSRNRCTSSR